MDAVFIYNNDFRFSLDFSELVCLFHRGTLTIQSDWGAQRHVSWSGDDHQRQQYQHRERMRSDARISARASLGRVTLFLDNGRLSKNADSLKIRLVITTFTWYISPPTHRISMWSNGYGGTASIRCCTRVVTPPFQYSYRRLWVVLTVRKRLKRGHIVIFSRWSLRFLNIHR